ncbi:MAG: FliM/FliN family flagellar motor switch protein [Robiginitomaculum sp.]|nr:FliM/FliN family flagellar motor switch protein [Robiginitomaculum sp.]
MEQPQQKPTNKSQKPDEHEQNIPVHERRDQDEGAHYKRSIYALDVNVQVVIGTARPTIGELLLMKKDSLIPLDCKLEDPVDLVIDGRIIARGDLIETDHKTGAIGVKLTEIVDVSEDMLQ